MCGSRGKTKLVRLTLDGSEEEWTPLPVQQPATFSGKRYGFEYFMSNSKMRKNLLWVIKHAQSKWPIRADVLCLRIHMTWRTRRKTHREYVQRRRSRSTAKTTDSPSSSGGSTSDGDQFRTPPVDPHARQDLCDVDDTPIIKHSGRFLSPGFFATPKSLPKTSGSGEASSSSSSARSNDPPTFRGYPKFPVNLSKFPAGKAPPEGWKVGYIAEYTNSKGKKVEGQALLCRTDGPSTEFPGYLHIFAGNATADIDVHVYDHDHERCGACIDGRRACR